MKTLSKSFLAYAIFVVLLSTTILLQVQVITFMEDMRQTHPEQHYKLDRLLERQDTIIKQTIEAESKANAPKGEESALGWVKKGPGKLSADVLAVFELRNCETFIKEELDNIYALYSFLPSTEEVRDLLYSKSTEFACN